MITQHQADQDDGDVQLSYGRADDGRLLHIAEVPSGLACNCVCPGCGDRLVARKGHVRAPHFAHHVTAACQGAWETTLHLLAKQLAQESRDISLPAVTAAVGDLVEIVHPPSRFSYESAEDEVLMAASGPGQEQVIIPDTVLRRGDRALLVEFAVTHFCGPEKIAEIRRRQLPAIEIDLSRIPRHGTRDEHAALIAAAPRKWLFNRLQEAAIARLRLQVDRRLAAQAERIRSLLDAPRQDGDQASVTRMLESGLGQYLGLPVEGGAASWRLTGHGKRRSWRNSPSTGPHTG